MAVFVALVAAALLTQGGPENARAGQSRLAPARLLIKGATVVTMDRRRNVIPDGRVLVEGNTIAAVWRPGHRPAGVRTAGAKVITVGPRSLLFPGLINLHDHPNFGVLPPWPTPSSHEIPTAGKPGPAPYANRYQWNTNSPDEYDRLVRNPSSALNPSSGLGLGGELVKYTEVGAVLGGETAIQGAGANPESDASLVRNIDTGAFDARIAPPRVGPIETFTGPPADSLRDGMRAGLYDAWMVHLAEGVRDSDRRPGDSVSSRAEFQTLADRGLLTDETVVLHGTALQRPDFARMHRAGSPRTDRTGDGRGAKLVWSPRSNLVLYGETTRVFEALAERVLVSLGTDWTPSGSGTLLDELKVASRVLRGRESLAGRRGLVPRLAVRGKRGQARARAEIALDRALVEMTTRNPAISLRWNDRVGTIAKGMRADLLLVTRPVASSVKGVPPSPYRRLIDASERDVMLVTVDGQPLAGSVPLMRKLKPGDFETVRSSTGAYRKAIDVTCTSGAPECDESFQSFRSELAQGLHALGGDSPPPSGGPADSANTYSYLKAHWDGGAWAGASDSDFRSLLISVFGVDSAGRLNIEAIDLTPVLGPDRLRSTLNDARVTAAGVPADPAPPFRLYPATLNQVSEGRNPLAGIP